jgi:hypothetical protein
MKNFRGHKGCTHRVVFEHHGGQDGQYDDQKRKRRRKSRSSIDVMGNRFPNMLAAWLV